jgi:hypothetical protein
MAGAPAPGRTRRLTTAVIAAVVGMFLVSIVMPVEAGSGTITYALVWDAGGVETGPDGSWSVTTDLGYEVTVTDGTLTTFSASAVACPHLHGVLDRLFGFMSLPAAWAGHPDDEDPALVAGPSIESLIDLAATELGTATVHEPSYCEGFTNWGSNDSDPTLTLTGSWVATDGTAGTLEISTTVDWGTKSVVVGADGSTASAAADGDGVTIAIVRPIARIFDGVEFVSADDEELARAVLRSLAANTSFVVVDGA